MSDSGKQWIDRTGRFLFGKYDGELVEDVVADDPGYIRWILEVVEDISEEDRAVFYAHLGRQYGRRR